MNESKIREQIKALMGLVNPQSLTSQEEYGHVLQGATGIIVLLYGRGSVQLSSFQAGVVAEEKRVAKEWHESQRGSMAQFISGVLSNVLAELDAGLIGSIRQQAEGEVLADFVALSRAALDEKGDQAKNVAAVLAAAAFEGHDPAIGGDPRRNGRRREVGRRRDSAQDFGIPSRVASRNRAVVPQFSE